MEEITAVRDPKSPLGHIVGRLLKIALGEGSIDADLENAADAEGWTLEEVLEELDHRGVSQKWQFNAGVGALEIEEG